MRQTLTFQLDDTVFWKQQLLHWATTHEIFMLLDANDHRSTLLNDEWDLLLGAGAADTIEMPAGHAFESFKAWKEHKQDWVFGAFAYDLKNETERLVSTHPDHVGFPDLLFFQPETVVGIRGKELVIQTLHASPDHVLEAIRSARSLPGTSYPAPDMQPKIAKADYLETVERIRQHIIEGDLYELNFCQEYFAENAQIDPLQVWKSLKSISKAPMSAFFRWHERYVISASPERFIKKEGRKLISQPIKGTRRRQAENDDAMRAELAVSIKDRAENVMIVDLVRNDLARSAEAASVKVEELFGIYTFETVHQMISTVSSQLKTEADAIDALRYAFPPGSMTGAPKVMAMELIEQYERSRRGLYAGALGYIDPAGDFDFNVLIRTIFYNERARTVSFQVGGAIVYDSVPEEEFDECQVKAAALFRALGQSGV